MELIFEIGCEELPASFIEPALDQIGAAFKEACAQARLTHDEPRLLATPRRLTLLVGKMSDVQEDLEEVRTGPPAAVAFKDGKPTGAAQGFARGQGVSVDDLYTVQTEKGEYVAARVFERGLPGRELLPQILGSILEGLHFPKSMRWGAHTTTFARPLRWILAVADGEVVPLQFADVASGNQTFGHRFAAPHAIDVKNIDGYEESLKKAQVMLDPEERKAEICKFCKSHAAQAGGRIVADPALVDEVANLIEWPFAVTLNFDEKYLELPREVLISSMRSHQRYFAVEKEDGSALLPACVVIYNTPVRDPKVVAQGNLRVLRARLDDARFFWDKDRDTPLDEHFEKLSGVIWIGPLGTMKARSERISTLAARIGREMGLTETEQRQAAEAGKYSKTDLVTHLVDEFPDLQGIIGGEYALAGGKEEAVATAIGEQYLPKSADDALPTTDVSACVAMAEKLDAIVGCFGVDMIPSSTSDPYGLRRAALGVLRILRDRDSSISISHLVGMASKGFTASPGQTGFQVNVPVTASNFLLTRFRFLLEEEAPTDVVNAVFATDVELASVASISGRIKALTSLRDQEDFTPLALGFKRAVNILEKQAKELNLDEIDLNPSLFEVPAEEHLFQAYEEATSRADEALQSGRWDAACRVLMDLKEPIDQFFDAVMVMAEDKALRENRLALLHRIRGLFQRVADVSRIQT